MATKKTSAAEHLEAAVVITPSELLALIRAAVREELATLAPANDDAKKRPKRRPRCVSRPPGESDATSARLAANALRRCGFVPRGK